MHNGVIYCMPSSSNFILMFDIESGGMSISETISTAIDTGGWQWSGAVFHNNVVYAIPFNSNYVLKYAPPLPSTSTSTAITATTTATTTTVTVTTITTYTRTTVTLTTTTATVTITLSTITETTTPSTTIAISTTSNTVTTKTPAATTSINATTNVTNATNSASIVIDPLKTNKANNNASVEGTNASAQEQGDEQQQQQPQEQPNERNSISPGLAAGVAIITILIIAVIGVAVAMHLSKSHNNAGESGGGGTNSTSKVGGPETVEAVQNPAFDCAAVGTSRSRAGSTLVGAAGATAWAANYLEPNRVQPKVYEGLKKTRQLVAAGELALDLDGYVVDETDATITASSPSAMYATIVSLDLDGYVVDEEGGPTSSSPSVVYATAIDSITGGKPAVVYAVPIEKEDALLKTAAAVEGTPMLFFYFKKSKKIQGHCWECALSMMEDGALHQCSLLDLFYYLFNLC